MSAPKLALTSLLALGLTAPAVLLGATANASTSKASDCWSAYTAPQSWCPSPSSDRTSRAGAWKKTTRPAPFANSVETRAMQGMRPFVAAWREAIRAENAAAALLAAENYELEWQAVEAWVNHRSVVNYEDIEVDTQFEIEKIIAGPNPDWDRASRLIDRLAEDLEAIIAAAANGPQLSTIFEDLEKVRRARAYILVARTVLGEGDLDKARSFVNGFNSHWTVAARNAVGFRSGAALAAIQSTFSTLTGRLSDPAASQADRVAAMTAFNSRLGHGTNLINAAARGATRPLAAGTFGSADRANLAALNEILLAVRAVTTSTTAATLPAGISTGPNTAYATVAGALEAKARFINAAPALRNALNALTAGFASGTPSEATLTTLKNSAFDAIEVARQAMVGEYWGQADLQAYLESLPD